MNFKPTLWKIIFSIVFGLFLGIFFSFLFNPQILANSSALNILKFMFIRPLDMLLTFATIYSISITFLLVGCTLIIYFIWSLLQKEEIHIQEQISAKQTISQ